MRTPSSVFAVGRYAAGLILVASSVVLMSAPKNAGFAKHERAFYADANTVAFVRPGLNITIVSAKVASDGTISVDYQVTDPKGLPMSQVRRIRDEIRDRVSALIDARGWRRCRRGHV